MSEIPTKEEIQAALEERHGKELQRKLEKTTVSICGLGGLGSHIAVSLARMGVGKLLLIDFDRVEITNLHRQQYQVTQVGMWKTEALLGNLREIAPYIDIQIHTCRVTPENVCELVKDADIICEAFDAAEQKAMLINSISEQLPEKYLVAASGMAGFADANLIHTRKITGHFILCGDETSDISAGVGLAASRVMVCAGHQAHAVIQVIANELKFY